MDSDGLPLVGPGIDYTKVESINQKRLIAFLNHFVTHTAGFLNRFSCVCEEKLENLSHRLQQLEITMNLLDAKINSIGPEIEQMTAPASGGGGGGAPATDAAAPQAPGVPAAPPPPGAPVSTPQAPSEAAPPPPPQEEKVENPVSKDPRYMKYFKMAQVGVPEPVVRMKMTQDGLNPDLLDTPDAPAPPGGGKNDDDDDFSDRSDDDDDDSDFD